MTHVHIIHAVCTSDFEAMDIMVAGSTKEAAQRAFDELIDFKWNNEVDDDVREFYEELDAYRRAWRQEAWFLPIAEDKS